MNIQSKYTEWIYSRVYSLKTILLSEFRLIESIRLFRVLHSSYAWKEASIYLRLVLPELIFGHFCVSLGRFEEILIESWGASLSLGGVHLLSSAETKRPYHRPLYGPGDHSCFTSAHVHSKYDKHQKKKSNKPNRWRWLLAAQKNWQWEEQCANTHITRFNLTRKCRETNSNLTDPDLMASKEH